MRDVGEETSLAVSGELNLNEILHIMDTRDFDNS